MAYNNVPPVVVVTKTATYTATLDDDVILGDATGGAITINLPAVAGARGQLYQIKKIDASANTVTIDASGAEVIDNATTYVLNTQYQSVSVVCDSAKWWIL